MAATPNRAEARAGFHSADLFLFLMGCFLGLALLKFGNPVILDRTIVPPEDWLEAVYQPWPICWGYLIFIPVAFLGLRWILWNGQRPHWVVFLPLLWWGWQCVAASRSVDGRLTEAVLLHFSLCVVCFYLGYFVAQGRSSPYLFWPLVVAFAWNLWIGIDQHFGGLEEARRYFYLLPNWRQFPPEFLKKVASDRIYGSLFYPNTLAGAILLWLPIAACFLWNALTMVRTWVRFLALSATGLSALAVLYWSGSKAGWLIFLAMGLFLLGHAKISKGFKTSLIIGLAVLGSTLFGVKYSKFFQGGAPSVVARSDYWHAAMQIAIEHPTFGTGPGTFRIAYKRIKQHNAEMTRLVHNDYLEQASDAGMFAFFTYFAFIIGSIMLLYRYSFCFYESVFRLEAAVWLGLTGLAIHSFVEFHLYVPALAWAMFFFWGWLWNGKKRGTIALDGSIIA